MIVYIAGPLFTSAECEWNLKLRNNLSHTSTDTFLLPQEFCAGLVIPESIAQTRLTKLRECAMIIVNCDGTDVDSGTAMEFGYAKALGLKSIAYRTDFRRSGDCNKEMNLMVAEQADACLVMPLAGYSEVGRAILGTMRKLWKSTD